MPPAPRGAGLRRLGPARPGPATDKPADRRADDRHRRSDPAEQAIVATHPDGSQQRADGDRHPETQPRVPARQAIAPRDGGRDAAISVAALVAAIRGGATAGRAAARASVRLRRCRHAGAGLAERVGFEPTEARASTVFKTASLNHSDTSPRSLSLGHGAQRMTSVPRYGCRTCGTRTVPSGAWCVSSSAAMVRGSARPEPFRVCTSSGRAPPSGGCRIAIRRAW